MICTKILLIWCSIMWYDYIFPIGIRLKREEINDYRKRDGDRIWSIEHKISCVFVTLWVKYRKQDAASMGFNFNIWWWD